MGTSIDFEKERMSADQPEPYVNRYELTITAEAEVIKAEVIKAAPVKNEEVE